MRRRLAEGFELDDDATRVDVAEVHRLLSEESYCARGRPLETVERLVREASRSLLERPRSGAGSGLVIAPEEA